MKRTGIFLDSNAGTPTPLNVRQALLSHLEGAGARVAANASSIHTYGRSMRNALDEARDAVARSLGTDPEQLVFTSSGSESNQLAIKAVLDAAFVNDPHPRWILSAVEHDCVRALCEGFEARGGIVHTIGVDAEGALNLSELYAALQTSDAKPASRVALVSLVWVNNETGVLLPLETIQQISRACEAAGAHFSLDACQAWGKVPIQVDELGAQWVSFSAHKIGGLSGTGVLWVAPQAQMPFGVSLGGASGTVLGKQEKGRRGGSENTMGIIALGAAASIVDPISYAKTLAPLQQHLERLVLERIPGAHINGHSAPRVCNTSNFSFDQIEGDGLVMALDLEGFCVSAGSACSSGVMEPSHVLLAMGRSRGQALAAVRVSLHLETTQVQIDAFVEALSTVVSRFRNAKRSFATPATSPRPASPQGVSL